MKGSFDSRWPTIEPDEFDPAKAIEFAESLGWVQQPTPESQSHQITAYADPEDPNRYAVIPLEPHSPSFRLLIRDTLAQFARSADQSVDVIATAVRLGATDIWEYAFPTARSGSISLREFAKLAPGIRRTIDAMASPSVQAVRALIRDVSPKGLLGTPLSAARYVESLEAGPSKPGSYIVTVLAPLNASARRTNSLKALLDQPVERLINIEIEQRFRAVRESMDRISSGHHDFEPEIRRLHGELGLRANAFKAISSLSDDVDSRFNIRLVKAEEKTTESSEGVVIKTPDQEILRRAADLLEEESQSPVRVSIIGSVNVLERGPRDSAGMVAIHGAIVYPDVSKTRPGIVKLELDAETYRQAMEANENRAIVEAVGELENGVNSRRLVNLVSFEVRRDISIDDLQ